MAGRKEGEKRMDMKRVLKGLRFIVIAGAVLFAGLGMNKLEVQAVGIHVDEKAADTAGEDAGTGGDKGTGTATGDDKSTGTVTDGDTESGAAKGDGGHTDGDADKGHAEADPTTEDAQVTPMPGGNPSAEWLWEVGNGKRDMYGTMVEHKMGFVGDTSPTALDISKGTITISKDGAYTQDDGANNKTEGTIPENQFTISGTTTSYHITVEPGAAPTIQVKGLGINLAAAEGSAAASGLYIKSGATVTLVLGNLETDLSGGAHFPGITLEPGATLKISGEGQLNVIGGPGAFGISGPSNARGGSFFVGEKAEIKSYSDQKDGALYAAVSPVSSKLLQGTLYSAATTEGSDPSVLIKVENRDDPGESYDVKLPIKYRSFATSTTLKGGSYVSYYPGADGGIQDSNLLVDTNMTSRHSYNLEGAGTTFASLSDLVSRRVEYTLTFNANGGIFNVNNTDKLQVSVGYGEKVTLPTDGDVARKEYTLRGWYRIKDSTNDDEQWNEQTDRVVRDNIILYATWKPNSCTVQYRSGNAIVKTQEGYTYEATVPYDQSFLPGPGYKPGYTLAYWKGPDGERWVFGTDGTKLTRKTTVLNAVWLADCKVTFDPNAGDEKIDGWPITEETQATSLLAEPASRDLVREDFNFTGKWYKDKACTKEWDFAADTVTKDITLYAGWGAKVTKVTFMVDKQAEEVVTPPDVDVDFGVQIPVPEATKPDRVELPTEYTVEGWYTDKECTKKWDFSEPLIDADGIFNLYPKWEQTVYWALLQPGDKEATPQKVLEQMVPNGSSLKTQYGDNLSTLFKKPGYKITGWKDAKTGKKWDVDAPLTEDITLTAVWEANVYTMRFVTEEGAPPMPAGQDTRSVVFGRTTEAPKYGTGDTAWPGHTFHGWYTDQNPEAGKPWRFAGEAGADAMPAKDVTLYAYWTKDKYRVSFHTYTGDEEQNKFPDLYPLYYGDSVVRPQDPVRAHYDFQGWYKDEELKNQWDFTKDTVTGDMTLYAGWKAHPIQVELHVKYEPENKDHPGEVVDIPYDQEVYYGDYLDRTALESMKQTSARPGYTLNGWYTDAGYGEDGKWDFPNSKVEPESEHLDLYAYWTWDEYTVSFQTWDGDSQVPPLTGVRYGQTIPKPNPNPARPHYTFDNWYADLNADPKVPWDFGKDVVKGDMSLYANWIPDTYTLSFETNGGTKLDPVQVTYGDHVPADALQTTKPGYTLAGWYRDSALTKPFAPGTDYVDGNMTIYAAWDLEKYDVTYHFRNSKDSPQEENITYKNTYHAGDYLTKPDKKVPHKTLSSWYKSPSWDKDDKWVFKRDTVEGDTDLYAYWSDTMYNVHFETSGGTEIKDTELPWGSQLDPPKAPERPGSTFDGWYKDEECQTPWDFEEDFVNGDTDIYAKWNLTMCTVTFDADGGLPVPDIQVLPYGSLITEPAAPEKEGDTFTGWKAEGAKDNWDFAGGTVEGDTLLTAQWEQPGAEPTDPTDPTGDQGNPVPGPDNQADPNNQATPTAATGNGDGSTNTPTAKNGGAATGNGTDTKKGTDTKNGTDTAGDDAKKALANAADELKKILTGDKAPLTYLVTVIFISAAVIIGILRKKYK